jgi:hypothetical protein
MPGLQAVADSLSRLAEYLKIAQNRVLYQLGTEESFGAAVAVSLYAADAIQNVVGIEAVTLHNGTASRNTLSLISG